MRSKRLSNLSLNAYNRRRKRIPKAKKRFRHTLLMSIRSTRKPKTRNFGTPQSAGIKRQGSHSPFATFTSPRRWSPGKRTPSSRPRASKLRKNLNYQFRNIMDKSALEINCDLDGSISVIRDSEEIISKKPKVSNEENEILVLWKNSLEALKTAGLDTTVQNFLKLFSSGRFPSNNIALRLFADVVKWFTCQQTTEMRYSRESKMFWKLGYRLFGGRFLHFMGGNKNEGAVVCRSGNQTNLDPAKSDINFAVPTENILRQFDPYLLQKQLPDFCPPGVLHNMIEYLQDSISDTSFCLTFDGKKLKQGLTQSSGDVDLFGFELKESLVAKQQKLLETVSPFQEIEDLIIHSKVEDISDLEPETRLLFYSKMENALKQISQDILEIKDVRAKKLYAKQKLIERCGEADWKNSKFVMAISSLIAYIHEIDEFITNATEVLNDIIICLAYLNNNVQHLLKGTTGNLFLLQNYLAIEEIDFSSSRTIKQRTDVWLEKRKSARVTGSTFYRAIGLDGLKRQRDYFEELLCGFPENHSDKVREFMAYGTQKEPSAMLTLAGKVAPVVFPKMICCEEGFVELGQSYNNGPFMVVSPDGSIRTQATVESTQAAIELKCPVSDIHKSLPVRYFLQCQAEIASLNVESLVYLCWKPDFSSVFIVQRQEELFTKAYRIAENLYNTASSKRVKSISPDIRMLKRDITEACSDGNCVTFVGLFPSIDHNIESVNQYEADMFTCSRAEYMVEAIIRLFKSKYELLRERATEAIVFLCSTMERSNSTKSLTVPVCWFTKGYSLDSLTMRNITEHVMNECNQAGLHIPAISFDGQWHQLAVRDVNDRPLTILQLQKDVWREVEKKKKQDILAEIKVLNKDPKWDIKRNDKSEIIRYIVKAKNNERLPKMSERVQRQRRIEMERKRQEQMKSQSEKLSIEGGKECSTLEDIDNNVDQDQNTDATNESRGDQDQTSDDEHKFNSFFRKEINDTWDSSSKKAIGEQEATIILKMLKTDPNSNKKDRWTNVTVKVIESICNSAQQLMRLRDVDLKVLVRYLKKKGQPGMKESEKKNAKLQNIIKALKLIENESEPMQIQTQISRQTRRSGVVESLQTLSFAKVSKLTKSELNIIYAEYVWPKKLTDWQQKAFKIKTTLYEQNKCEYTGSDYIDHLTAEPFEQQKGSYYEQTQGTTDFFYVPAHSQKRGQYEVSCIDSSHLLTRTRRKCCKGGLDGLSNDAWYKVAKSGKTNLTLALVECIIDPVSVPIAVTHFSESVEKAKIQNGDLYEARLCRDIREWWRADDDPGISARERIRMRLALRRRLLQHVNFGHFPPPGMFIKGWPSQLWEGLIANIDASFFPNIRKLHTH